MTTTKLSLLTALLISLVGCYPTVQDLDLASITEGESCAHVSVCQDAQTLYDCIIPDGQSVGTWRKTTCVQCIPAGDPSIIGTQLVPVCMKN